MQEHYVNFYFTNTQKLSCVVLRFHDTAHINRHWAVMNKKILVDIERICGMTEFRTRKWTERTVISQLYKKQVRRLYNELLSLAADGLDWRADWFLEAEDDDDVGCCFLDWANCWIAFISSAENKSDPASDAWGGGWKGFKADEAAVIDCSWSKLPIAINWEGRKELPEVDWEANVLPVNMLKSESSIASVPADCSPVGPADLFSSPFMNSLPQSLEPTSTYSTKVRFPKATSK